MTLEQIKTAVRAGRKVFWKSHAYEVQRHVGRRTGNEQWLIVCTLNQDCIGLTHLDGVTMNGKELDFFVDEA